MKYILFLICLGVVCHHINAQTHLNQLQSKEAYEMLCGTPLVSKYGNVTAVKILFDTKKDQIYYINANEFKNHYSFCTAELQYTKDLALFNKQNYTASASRRYLLANINYIQVQDKYVVEISPVDMMSAPQVNGLFTKIQSTVFCDKKLFFLLNSPRLNKLKTKITFPTITPTVFFGDLQYQAISKYTSTGTLRIIEDIKTADPIKEDEIIILKTIPNYIPICAGLIVTEFQTPLSHVSILGLNRKIPICAYTDIFSNQAVLNLNGKTISLSVMKDTFVVCSKMEQVPARAKQQFHLKKDVCIQRIVHFDTIDVGAVHYIGGKASNFAKLYKISQQANFKVPEGAFAIPFYYYENHMRKSHAQEVLFDLLKDTSISEWKEKALLYGIQELIKNTPIDQELITLVEKQMRMQKEFSQFRFRSSTNAEDIKGFSGAGLYTSKTAKIDNSKKNIEHAIAKVWASLWSHKAYAERKYFGISQKDIAMGILVHRAFPNEVVNGVAITKNIYRDNSNGFVVNTQLGNISVVNPPEGIVCEQFICFPEGVNVLYDNKHVVDIIAYSSYKRNELIMTEKEIQNLANQLALIKCAFYGSTNNHNYRNRGLDVEFKLDGETRTLYIKQVREYND